MSKIIGIIIVVAVTTGAGWFIYNDINKNNDSTGNTIEDNTVATSTNDIITDTKNLDDVIVDIGPIIPNLNKPIVFYNDELTEEAKTLLREKITESRSNLKENSDLFSEWLSLGVNYKIAGDYESAKDAWEYASIIRPLNNVSFSNLGDLYHFYLKDFPKAEQNLRTSIENDKKTTTTYIILHELYKYSYKQDTTLAVDILLEGLKENPDNVDLLVTLATYYKEVSDITNAKKYYEQAHSEAKKLKNTQLVELLEEEISKL